ncbi:hypothetical protein [Mycobacterium sp. 1465703.0]|uniref:hypothetical protein n=1 Tax=Mycobacterium sp. 1465703.0 TaxID=1834078 RepID=UPI0012EB04D8|nr:hypothetical protein [Mycobacterium sp. 1465703.0]
MTTTLCRWDGLRGVAAGLMGAGHCLVPIVLVRTMIQLSIPLLIGTVVRSGMLLLMGSVRVLG